MIIHGRQLIVKLNSVTIAAQKSCDIEVRSEEIPISSPTQGLWQDFIAGRKSWSLTCNQLVTAIGSNINMVGQRVTLTFGKGSDSVSGTALVLGWKCTGTIGNLAQAVASFRGCGPLTVVNPST